jgi:cyclopropane-fatty-acyl-phospholipid synthase
VLDIGSGWGGMAIYLALVCDAEVTGITLSREQLRVATARAEALGLAGRVRFELSDYRAVTGRYDAIVSVGMFEHVGLAHYPAFFETLARRLDPAGVALLHAIGQPQRARAAQAFIAKHIFPDGFLPSLAQELAPIEPTGLQVRDVEVLAIHYADTLREWRRRFLARRSEAAARYDERFVRMWEFYLAGSESSFRAGLTHVFQVQLAHDPARVPTTRAFIAETSARLAAREAEIPLYADLHPPRPASRRRVARG